MREATTPAGDIAGMFSFSFFLVITCIHFSWDFVLVWVSLISIGLCYCLDYIIKNYYMSFACHESLIGFSVFDCSGPPMGSISRYAIECLGSVSAD